MTSFETSLQKAVDGSIRKTVEGYVDEFSSKLAEALNSGKKKEWTTDSFIEMWKEIVSNPKKKEGEVDHTVPQCEHVYGKGDKKDKRCVDKVSDKSKTKSFCSRHYKQKEQKDQKDEKKESLSLDKPCCYILTKGKNKDDECGQKVSSKCDKKKYCNKHRTTGDTSDKKQEKKSTGKGEPIRAYRIKDGTLKGFHAFEKGGKKYVIESETKTIKGCEDDGELVDLDDDDIRMVLNTPPFKLDSKYLSKTKNLSKDENEDENEEDDVEEEEEDVDEDVSSDED